MKKATRFRKLVLLLPLVLLIPVFAAWKYISGPKIKKAENYNILLISIDTARADFFGPYGNRLVATPNIDRLANQGVLFESFYSTINTTLAAHSSMFTGLYPRNHGVGRNSMRLNEKTLTMAEYLHAKGYTTAGFIASFALSTVFRIQQGFEKYEESFIGNMDDYYSRNRQFANRDEQGFEIVLTKQKVGHIERKAEDVNEVFFQWLEGNKDKKFFAFLHYYDPHFPYLPPEKWYKKHLKNIPQDTPLMTQDRPPFEQAFEGMSHVLQEFRAAEYSSLQIPESLAALIKLYAAEIEYVDFAIGEVLKRLKKSGLSRKTIIIVTADHGENLIEHPEFKSFFRHGFLTHQSETHIPFIIFCPGLLPEGRRVEQVGSQIDLFPTVTELLGYQPPKVDGVSLAKDLFGNTRELKRIVFSEASQPHVDLRRQAKKMVWVNDNNSAAAIRQHYKYIHAPWISYEAIFDLSHDPLERKNIFGTADGDLISDFQNQLKQWRSTASLGNVDSDFQLSDEDRDRLKSLGYVQ